MNTDTLDLVTPLIQRFLLLDPKKIRRDVLQKVLKSPVTTQLAIALMLQWEKFEHIGRMPQWKSTVMLRPECSTDGATSGQLAQLISHIVQAFDTPLWGEAHLARLINEVPNTISAIENFLNSYEVILITLYGTDVQELFKINSLWAGELSFSGYHLEETELSLIQLLKPEVKLGDYKDNFGALRKLIDRKHHSDSVKHPQNRSQPFEALIQCCHLLTFEQKLRLASIVDVNDLSYVPDFVYCEDDTRIFVPGLMFRKGSSVAIPCICRSDTENKGNPQIALLCDRRVDFHFRDHDYVLSFNRTHNAA